MPNAGNSKLAGPGRGYFVFLVIFLACLGAFPSFVNDLYLPTLPQMRTDFHTTTPIVQLGLSFVMIGLGAGELFWGPLSDKTGRKPVLFMSLSLFAAASIASVFSPTIWFFIFCRLFQGLGASGAVLLARSIPADECHGRDLAKIMALIGAINGIAPVSGPLLGGFMAKTIGWRGIFCVLACIGLAMIITSFWFRESLPRSRRKEGTLIKLMGEYLPLLKNRRFMAHVMLKSAALGVLFSYISAGPFISLYPQVPLWFETSAFRPNKPAPGPEGPGIRRGRLAWEGSQTPPKRKMQSPKGLCYQFGNPGPLRL